MSRTSLLRYPQRRGLSQNARMDRTWVHGKLGALRALYFLDEPLSAELYRVEDESFGNNPKDAVPEGGEPQAFITFRSDRSFCYLPSISELLKTATRNLNQPSGGQPGHNASESFLNDFMEPLSEVGIILLIEIRTC